MSDAQDATATPPDRVHDVSEWISSMRMNEDHAGELPAHHPHCLGCRPANPHSHHLRAHRQGEGVVAQHVFDERHVGAPGIAHGGAVATVIDDLFGFLLYAVGELAVTRELRV